MSHGERIVVQVIAQNKYGNSSPSAWSPLSQKMITTPGVPKVTFTDKTYDSVTLNWDPVERADEYFIHIDGLRSAVTQETTYTLTNQRKYNTFVYTVIAGNACANSPASQPLTVSFQSIPGPFDPVTSDQGTGKDRCNLFISWEKPTETGGKDILAYRFEIRGVDKKWYTVEGCGENVEKRECKIKMRTLFNEPFDINSGELIEIRGQAQN